MTEETFASRGEAIDFGKDYEYLMAAYYSLILSFDDQVTDFKISSNNRDMGDFDDIVIECTLSNGEEHVFVLQLKHIIRPIAQIHLVTDNKKFGLKKYSKEFQKVKTKFAKSGSYNAPFENFHFVLFSNSTLENYEAFDGEWKRLEPVANNQKHTSDISIRRNEDIFTKKFLNVSNTTDNLLYEFKSETEKSADSEFFKQFSLYTKQKSAKEMESLIAETVMKKFSHCDPSVPINYLNYFSYWCRRDFGAVKLTKEDVRVKIAELILTQYIPEPNLENLTYFTETNLDLLFMMFLFFDVVMVENQSQETIDRIWNVVLKKFSSLSNSWSSPFKGVYAESLVKGMPIPVSAFSENFNELTLKKYYVLMWHTGCIPMVIRFDKKAASDILLAIELTENHGNKKKVVLIGEDCSLHFDTKWKVFKNLSDLALTYSSVDSALENLPIPLQGRPSITLKQILDIDEGLMKSLTVAEIIFMMGKNCVVGKDCTKDFPKYYVKRSLAKAMLDTKVIDEVETDLFVVSCDENISGDIVNINSIEIDKYLLLNQFGSNKNYLPKQVMVTCLEKNNTKTERFFILAKGGCSKSQFKEVCSMNEGKNCHHVRFSDGKIEWVQTGTSVEQIRKYRLDNKTDLINEEDVLSYFDNSINLLSADPGMGKSIMMKLLMTKCPADHWSVLISLGDHANFFKRKRSVDDILAYFLPMEYHSSFAKDVIGILSKKKQILFLWDGFDELPEDCMKFVITAVKNLARDGYPQWVAARSNSQRLLEDEFATFAFTLTQFNQQNQYDYVYSHLKDQYEEETKVNEIIDEINKNIRTWLSCGYFDYTGVPLQLHMVVEIYLKKSTDLTMITLTDIYQQFIEGKFDNLFEKADADVGNYYMEQIREEYRNAQLVLYENAAMKATFGNRLPQNLNLDWTELREELDEGGDSLELVVGIIDQKPVFAHKTYEEFLAASWLAKRRDPELIKLLFEDQYSNVRFMFDMLLARNNPIHLAVLYRNLEFIKEHEGEIAKSKDKGGRNALHVACSWGRRHPIVKLVGESEVVDASPRDYRQHFLDLITSLKQNNSNISQIEETVMSSKGIDSGCEVLSTFYQQVDDTEAPKGTILMDGETMIKVVDENITYLDMLEFLLQRDCDVLEEDTLLKWNVLQYGDQSLSLDALNMIAKHHSLATENLKNFNHIPTLLHYCVTSAYDYLLDTVKEIPHIEYKYKFGRFSLLQMASEVNNFNAVSKLLNFECYRDVLNAQSAFSGNLLSSASWKGNLEMMDVLLQHGINVNGHKAPPLLAAVFGNKFESCEKLLQVGADVNATGPDGNAPLLAAIMLNQREMIKLFLERGADVDLMFKGMPLVSYALNKGNEDIVRLILRYKPNLNHQCEVLGYTPLHLASELGDIDILKCLLEHGADTKIKSWKLLTPLQVALINKKKDIAVELITADPSAVNEYDGEDDKANMAPVMLATMANFPDVIKLLAENGADVHTRFYPTPLHFAASENLDSCVTALLEAGASVNFVGKNGIIPLFCASRHLSTTKLLLDNSADLNAKSDAGETALHFAALSGNLDVVEELINRGVDVNQKTAGVWTPLYMSIMNKSPDLMKFLLRKHSSVDDGNEMMCLAAQKDFPEGVSLLIRHGVDVNSFDKNGISALSYASMYSVPCMKLLLQNGANPNAGGNHDILPLMFPLLLSRTNVMSELLSAGATVDRSQTVNPLHVAAMLGDIFSLVLLIGNGADVNEVDAVGRTALHYVSAHDILPTFFAEALESGFNACINNNSSDCAQELIAKDADINRKDNKGMTPLHVACERKCTEIVKILIQHGADINSLNDKQQTPLHLCCSVVNTAAAADIKDLVQLLLDNGASVDVKDVDGCTGISYACSRGYLEVVKLLQTNGADLFVESNRGMSLLIEAYQHTPILKYLIGHGLDIDHKNDENITCLYFACIYNNYEAAEYLLSQGANVDIATQKTLLTPIHGATLNGHTEIVRLLLSYNANISIKSDLGNTPIFSAVGKNHPEIVNLFIEAIGSNKDEFKSEWIKSFVYCAGNGPIEMLKFLHEKGFVDVDDREESKQLTALHMACACGRFDEALYLIENGSDVDAINNEGNSPLYFASNGGYLDITKLLVERGAKIDLSNNHGNTGLYIAASNGYLEVVEFLYDSGAAINVVDADGDIPLHDAAYLGHLSVVQFLVSKNANINHTNALGKTILEVAKEQGKEEVVKFLEEKLKENNL